MAVLKSPKNNGLKNLWMKKTIQKSKRSTFYFYPENNKYKRSTLGAPAIKYNSTLYPIKHRTVKELYKQEVRSEGRILPSTLDKPNLRTSQKTYLASSWKRTQSLQLELSVMVNSSLF